MRDKEIAEVLNNLAKVYPLGFVSHWDQIKKNKWQKLLDDLDRSALKDTDGVFADKLNKFYRKAISMFQEFSDNKKQLGFDT